MSTQMNAQVNKLLSDVSNGFFDPGLIADKIFNTLPVKQWSGIVGAYTKQHLRIENDLMGGAAKARLVNSIGYDLSQFYKLQSHGLKDVVTKEDLANTDLPFQAQSDKTIGLTTKILLNKEVTFKNALFNTTTFSGRTTTPSTKYGNSSSDPMADFETARNAISSSVGKNPNAVVMSQQVYNALVKNPLLLELFKYTKGGVLSDDALKNALQVDTLLIGEGVYNNSVEGQPDNIVPLWSDSILFYVRPQAAGKHQVALGYNLQLSGYQGRQVFTSPEPDIPEALSIIVQDIYQCKLVEVGAGYLLNDVL